MESSPLEAHPECGSKRLAGYTCRGAAAEDARAIATVSRRCSTGTMSICDGIGIEERNREAADRASASNKTYATWAGVHQVK